jgi:hypothetical protein
MTDKGVKIVYRNHSGIVKEYFIIPHAESLRFDYPWVEPAPDIGIAAQKAWVFDAEVVRSPENVTRTFVLEKILEWKAA